LKKATHVAPVRTTAPKRGKSARAAGSASCASTRGFPFSFTPPPPSRLGAAILHAKQLKVESSKMIDTLSNMYLSAFGQWSFWLFLVGAIVVLYSTIFGATASNARLLADALSIFGLRRYANAEDRMRWVKISCVILPVAFTSVFLIFENPVTLVFWGAIAQGIMLPFLAGAALYFHFTNPRKELRAKPASLCALSLAAILMTALGIYQVNDAIQAKLKKPAPTAATPSK
jgi:manganese transport protein